VQQYISVLGHVAWYFWWCTPVNVGTVPSNEPAGSYPAVFSSHVLRLIQHCILAASAVGIGVIKYCI